VLPGTGVTWINDDTKVHIVKASGARPGMFNSGEILPTAQFSYTFGEDEGVFTFTDLKDPGMNGTIIVKKGASIVGAPPIQATLSPT
jgi:plastocyanin